MPEPGKSSVAVTIDGRVVRRLLAFTPWILAALGLAVEVAAQRARDLAGDPEMFGFLRLLSLSHEGNIPTLYQAGVLIMTGAMLWLIGRARKQRNDPWHRYWSWLGIGFLFMGIDEWTSVHELWNRLFDLPGVLFFGWIIPYSVLAVALAFVFVPFLRALPRPIAARFITSGTIYLAGAIGMELPLGWWTDRHGMENLGYSLIDWAEESLELVGAGIFATSVFGLFRTEIGSTELSVTERPGD